MRAQLVNARNLRRLQNNKLKQNEESVAESISAA